MRYLIWLLMACVMVHAAEPGSATSALPRATDSTRRLAGMAPTPDELRGEPLRKNLPSQYVEAKADFDGDGKEDHAALFTGG